MTRKRCKRLTVAWKSPARVVPIIVAIIVPSYPLPGTPLCRIPRSLLLSFDSFAVINTFPSATRVSARAIADAGLPSPLPPPLLPPPPASRRERRERRERPRRGKSDTYALSEAWPRANPMFERLVHLVVTGPGPSDRPAALTDGSKG